MSRLVDLHRMEAEYLVDLLEAKPAGPGEHYMARDIADTLREAFGMSPRPEERAP